MCMFCGPKTAVIVQGEAACLPLGMLPDVFVNRCCIIRTREGKCVIRNILLNQQQLLKVVDSKLLLGSVCFKLPATYFVKFVDDFELCDPFYNKSSGDPVHQLRKAG